jgi:pilus assembly protein FimV
MHKIMQAKNSRSMAFRLKKVSAAVISALVVVHASAAGLGKLTVLSAIGQPLRAEIELNAVSADEARNLQPKLASMDAFRQANIEFNPTLQSLRFAVEQRGGRQFIRITTTQPVSEPFVDVLLELNSASGRLVREYTFLLDPPELRSVQPAQMAAAAPVAAAASVAAARPAPEPAEATPRAQGGSRTAKSQPAAAAPARERAPVAARAPNGNSPGTEYQVRAGDSLSKIATRTKPDGISLDQMLVALFRANPNAFVGENMNRLRAGQILSVPSAEASGAVGASEATGIVIAQAANFNDYRNKLAGQVASGAAQKTDESRQSASGKIAAKVEERSTPSSEALDKLKLSKANANAAGKDAAVQEEKIARDKAAADSAARVKALEKNLSELQQLLDVKNKDLADRQRNAKAADTTKPAVAEAVLAAAATTPAATPAAPVVAQSKPVEAPKPATVVEPAAEKPAVAPETPAKPVKPAPKPAAAPEPGLFDDLLGNPLAQGGAVLVALLLGGLAFARSRSKKENKGFQDTSIPDSSLKTNSLFGTTGGQSVDTSNSVFNSSFAPAASNLDSNEVDPVAEADVYIAYGRDAQAEEILKEALRTQPERHAVRVKLLEIYASRKDTRAFESVATELYSMTKGEGEDWAQAASLGIALDPANPLYAGGDAVPAAVPHDPAVLSAAAAPDDSADLDAFLQEVSAAHPFADNAAADAHGLSMAPPAEHVEAHSALSAADFAVPAAAAAASVAVAEAVAKHDAAPADNSLDFDLDGMNFDAIDSDIRKDDAGHPEHAEHAENVLSPAAATTAHAADEMPLSAMDFDFLSNEHTAPAVAPLAPATMVEPVQIGEFNLEPAAAMAHAEHIGAEHDIFAPTASTADAILSMEPAAMQAAAAPARPDPLEFDLSGITLDLPEPEAPIAPLSLDMPVHHAGVATAANEDFTELDLSGATDLSDGASSTGISNNAEMSTKLDLAVAYQEIGDHEGARELLDEVIKGGSADQSEKAQSLLARLG